MLNTGDQRWPADDGDRKGFEVSAELQSVDSLFLFRNSLRELSIIDTIICTLTSMFIKTHNKST